MPAFAAGNSEGDMEMLTVATFALLIDHDDVEREFAYTDEKSLSGAALRGWTVVSMKDDWSTVFSQD
jgi:hypothetical protein